MWLYFWPSDHFVERGSPPSLLPAHTSGGVWLVSAALEMSLAPSCESLHPTLYLQAGLISQTYLHTLTRGRVQMPTPSCGWETTGSDQRCLNLKKGVCKCESSRLDGYNRNSPAGGKNPPILAGTHQAVQRPTPLENGLAICFVLRWILKPATTPATSTLPQTPSCSPHSSHIKVSTNTLGGCR